MRTSAPITSSRAVPRWIGRSALFPQHFDLFPLTSAPRHTRLDPRDLPRPRSHTREMTGKTCENCNGAPAEWFCNSDGKPARERAHLCLFSRGPRLFRSKTFPLRAHRSLTRSPARSAGAYLCTACDVSIHSANKVRRGSTAPRGANSGPSYALRVIVFFRGRDETPPKTPRPTRGTSLVSVFFSFLAARFGARPSSTTTTTRVLD